MVESRASPSTTPITTIDSLTLTSISNLVYALTLGLGSAGSAWKPRAAESTAKEHGCHSSPPRAKPPRDTSRGISDWGQLGQHPQWTTWRACQRLHCSGIRCDLSLLRFWLSTIACLPCLPQISALGRSGIVYICIWAYRTASLETSSRSFRSTVCTKSSPYVNISSSDHRHTSLKLLLVWSSRHTKVSSTYPVAPVGLSASSSTGVSNAS